MSSAAQLGGLLARVELFEDTVREKRKSAALLQCTTAAHSAEATPREKAGLMMAALRSGCECERSSLLLVDEVRGQLCVVSEDEDAAGPLPPPAPRPHPGSASSPAHSSTLPAPSSTPAGLRVPMGSGFAGSVVSSGERVSIVNAYEDPRFDSSIDRRTGFVTRSVLAVPIRCGERVAGVLQARCLRPASWTPPASPTTRLHHHLPPPPPASPTACLHHHHPVGAQPQRQRRLRRGTRGASRCGGDAPLDQPHPDLTPQP